MKTETLKLLRSFIASQNEFNEVQDHLRDYQQDATTVVSEKATELIEALNKEIGGE